MKYSEAQEYIKDNKNLIGTTTARGLNIGKLIIVPSNENSRSKFFSSYLLTNDEKSAILQYVNESVEVWAIDLFYLQRNNVLFYKKLIS